MFVRNQNLFKDLKVAVASALLISLMAWTFGFHYLESVHAASLTNVSDTLSDSRPGFAANHTVQYTNPSSTSAGQTIQITFDPTTSLFGGIGTLTPADVTSTQIGIQSAGCVAGGNHASFATTTNSVIFT